VDRISRVTVLALSVSSVLVTARAAADEPPKLEGPKTEYVAEAEQIKADKRTQGWIWKLSTGATASFGDNRNTVGQPSGTSFNFGVKLDGAADYNHDKHEFRNLLTLGEGVSRTPILPELIKSADTLSLDSIYLYHFVDWAGLFGRFSLQTSIFQGTDLRPAGITYQIARADGRVDNVGGKTDDLNRLLLSSPFRPLLLKQSIGPFARPVTSEKFNLELRLGAGARETIAKNQLAVNDDPKTATIVEVKELSNVNQVGVEFVASIWGDLATKRVSYRVGAEVMVPVAHNPLTSEEITALTPGSAAQPGAGTLTNIDLGARLSFKLVEWATLDYELKAVRQPQLLNAFQIQNVLLLTFGLVLTNKPKPPEPPVCPAPPAAPTPAAPPPPSP
jgi:hypothetical protein